MPEPNRSNTINEDLKEEEEEPPEMELDCTDAGCLADLGITKCSLMGRPSWA